MKQPNLAELEASAAQEMESLEQKVYDRDEEVRRLTNLLQAKEAEEEKQREEYEKELDDSDKLRGEISDLKAKLDEAEDRRLQAEEELENLRNRVEEMEHELSVSKFQYGVSIVY